MTNNNSGAVPGFEWRVQQVSSGLYDQIQPLVKKYASRSDFIEVTILVFSVLTSGAFWALISDTIPKAMGYAGAAVSTVVTFLTIYMYSSGLNTKRKTAIFIFKEIGKFMADVRASASMSEQEFWTKYKPFEGMIMDLQYRRVDS
jgi:hypothetical protein